MLSCDIAAGLCVQSDPLALDVVLRNVLENALAAVQAAGGGRVEVQARAANGEVQLTVRDSGVGFKPADGARLFEKFTRLHGGAGHYGTGLGLFIVRRMMELAHGRVSAHSAGVGQGRHSVYPFPTPFAMR